MQYERIKDKDIYALIKEAAEMYHSEQIDCGLKVGAEWAWPDEKSDKPPLMLHGYEVQAIMRKIPYRMRIHGVPDVIITIDGVNWREKLDEEERLALIDHELTHVEIVYDKKEGGVKLDKALRPVVRLLPHDWQMGGFNAVARRHGSKAPECKAYRYYYEKSGQLLLEFEPPGSDRSTQIKMEFDGGAPKVVSMAAAGGSKK